MFDTIEKLKQEYTDKYVVADATVAELARFEGYVGQVKTVNMNGRALVEFDCWSNIGWYDIELDYLKVVPKPDPQAKSAQPAPAASKPVAASPAPKAAGAAAGGKKSTAEILAAARAAKSAAPPTAAKPAAPASVEKKAPAAGKAKTSTADILAAARAQKAAQAVGEPAVEETATQPEVEPPKVESSASQSTETEPDSSQNEGAPKAASAPQPPFPPGQRPSVAEILAWCREHDAQ